MIEKPDLPNIANDLEAITDVVNESEVTLPLSLRLCRSE
jgi:hypothetical protein